MMPETTTEAAAPGGMPVQFTMKDGRRQCKRGLLMATNYDRMAADAALLFLKYDQEKMIRKWNLDADGMYLYLPFFSEENVLRIDRNSGRLSRISETQSDSDLNMEAMILYDLLTYSDEPPREAGEWASVSQLGGIIGAGHDSSLRSPLADAFAGKASWLDEICRQTGGSPAGKGDVSYAFTVFRNFRILMQFWDQDDEFPADVRFLFDRNALLFMHYETLWYVMGALERQIRDSSKGVLAMPEGRS